MNGLISALFAGFFWVYLNKVQKTQGKFHVEKKKENADKKNNWNLMLNYKIYFFMGLGSFFIWLANCVWNNGVSPYTISRGMPEWNYSILWTLNGILIFVAQPLISWIKRVFAATELRQMTASAVFYMLGYVMILSFHTYPSMVLAMVLITLGEMLISPAIPSFISDHTGKSAPFYLGLVGGMGVAGRVVGPYAMGVLFDWNGLVPVAALAVLISILSIASFMIHGLFNRDKVRRMA